MLLRSTRQCESGIVHNGARGCHDHSHGWLRWPRVDVVPYQALPLLQFFTCNIKFCARKNFKKVRKGEGEPRNEARPQPLNCVCTFVQLLFEGSHYFYHRCIVPEVFVRVPISSLSKSFLREEEKNQTEF